MNLRKRLNDEAMTEINVMTELDVTTKSSIVLSILVMNVVRIVARSLRHIFIAIFSRYLWQDFQPYDDQKRHRNLLVA